MQKRQADQALHGNSLFKCKYSIYSLTGGFGAVISSRIFALVKMSVYYVFLFHFGA